MANINLTASRFNIMLQRSSYSEEDKERLRGEYDKYIEFKQYSKLEELYWDLFMHQADPIVNGFNYNQTDINKRLDWVMLNTI